jgi:phage shock protein C
MAKKRLHKSATNEVIDGVCGGLGEYFDIDPVIIRIAWVIFALAGGSGGLAYLICMFVMPDAPETEEKESKEDEDDRSN